MGAPLMLGVSGLRGIVGESLTPEVAARFAAAFGAWLKDRPEGGAGGDAMPAVVVGADGRAGYGPILEGAARGLLASGCNPWNIGIAMTPTIAVKADHDDAAGAMVVTASHNPQEWNGLKCLVRSERGDEVVSACAPDARAASELVRRFHAHRAPAPAGGWAPPVSDGRDADGGHVGAVIGAVGKRPGGERRVRVVVDSVNGAGRFAARQLLADALGCDVTHLGADEGGVFPHPPEPLRENLVELCEEVRTRGAAIGFAQDPDADRLAIVDERGEYIGEEYTLVLAAEAVLAADQSEKRKAKSEKQPSDRVVVTNLSTSRMIDDVAARHGARVVRTPVGEANVVEAMKREKAAGADVVMGGEGNGGVIWPRVTYVRDSLSGMALVLALLARTGKTVSELVAAWPRYAIEKRKVGLPRREDAAAAVEKLAAAYQREKVDRQDGVRVDWPGRRAWLHVRASNTEPIMRLIAEAPSKREAEAILDEAARVVA